MGRMKRRYDKIPATLRAGWERTKQADAWAELLGSHVPEDVRRFRRRDDGGFLLADPDELLRAPNVFVEVLDRAAKLELVEPVLQMLANVYFLASVPGEGDRLMHHSPRDSETADVVVWNHETAEFHGPVAYDLPTVMRLLEAAASTDGVESRAELLRPALGRYDSEFPLTLLEDTLKSDRVWKAAKSGRQPKFTEPESGFVPLLERAQWVAQALTSRLPKIDAIKEQLGWSPEEDIEDDYPPSLLYWLWRSFFLGEEETFQDVLQRANASASRLVRDAAAFAATEAPRKLADQCKAVRELVGRAAFPDRFVDGTITLVRDDSLRNIQRAEAPHVSLAEPAGRQPMNAAWGEAEYCFLAAHPDGKHLLVSGHHDHPRRGRHPSIPDTVNALVEVDDTGTGRIFCTTQDGPELRAGAYWSEDRIVVVGEDALQLFERHAGRGVLVESLHTSQHKALFLREQDAVVLYRSLHDCPFPDGVNPPESIEIVRLEDGSLLRAATAPVALSVIATKDGEVVGADAKGTAGYRIEGVGTKVVSGVEFRPCAFVEQELEARTGPAAVLNALTGADCSYESASGRCLVLKAKKGKEDDFQVHIGDADGIRAAKPPLVSHNEWFEFITPDRGLVCTDGVAYSVDLRSGEVAKLFEPPTHAVHVLADGFAAVDDGTLSVWSSRGALIRQLELGDESAMLGTVFGGRAMAVSTEHTPLAVLTAKGDELRLVAYVGHDDPDLGSATFEVLQRPAGYGRLFARIDGELHKPFGLAAAIDDPSCGAKLGDTFPTEPIEGAIELRLAQTPAADDDD